MDRSSASGCLRLAVVLICTRAAASAASLDEVTVSRAYSKRPSADQLRESLQLSHGLLWKHNKLDNRLETKPLRHYVSQIDHVLQHDCCDYFEALPLVKNLTDGLIDVLELRLPPPLYPVLRRSYVASIWLLQRSKLFKWNTRYMQKLAMLGFYRLYAAHADISAGRPISFHHISKSGGTSLCKIAQANGCKGPKMNRAANCILNTGLDGPVWSLKHDVLVDNGIPPPRSPAPSPAPPSPLPPPPVRPRYPDNSQASVLEDDDDNDDDSGEHIPDEFFNSKPAVELPDLPLEASQWFMYDCNSMLAEKAAYGCRERQEAALAKSANFFANEHALSTQHGNPQVCSAFTNMIMVRDALSEVVSLIGEVTQVYSRLLRRLRVDAWQPPRWDLSWWQQRAPAVVSSYASRTLLGTPAFCPRSQTSDAGSTSRYDASSGQQAAMAAGSTAAGNDTDSWLYLSSADIQTAIEQLYQFDVVLELSSPDLIDISVSKLLGWSGQMFSSRARERRTAVAKVLTWQQLYQLAMQEPPAEAVRAVPTANSRSHPAAAVDDFANMDLDLVKRMIADVCIRQAYARQGVEYVITPLAAIQKPPLEPPASARAAALAALKQVNSSVMMLSADKGFNGHAVVEVLEGQTAVLNGTDARAVLPIGTMVATQDPGTTVGSTYGASGGVRGSQLYHIWPRHGVVLDDQQYMLLLRLTAADRQLHRHARLLQLIDAAWLSALGRQRGFGKLMAELSDANDKDECGLAGP